MATAEGAGACAERRLFRPFREPQPHMDIAAVTAAEVFHYGSVGSAGTSVNDNAALWHRKRPYEISSHCWAYEAERATIAFPNTSAITPPFPSPFGKYRARRQKSAQRPRSCRGLIQAAEAYAR